MAGLDPAKSKAVEREIGQILLDNALTNLTYYHIDAIWPVCPPTEMTGALEPILIIRRL